jgi:hypothetical protein
MNKFRVSVKSFSDNPVAEPAGDLSHKVVFHIDSVDDGQSTDWDGGTVRGEDIKRCLQLQEKGNVTVSQPEGWANSRPDRWQEEVINLALDHSVSESA